MKLYELKQGDKFKLSNVGGMFEFIKVDGMYAQVLLKGELEYIACFTEVILLENVG